VRSQRVSRASANKSVHGKFQYPLPLKKISKSTKRSSSRRDALEPVDETMPPADEDVDEEALLYGDVGACDGTRTNERTNANESSANQWERVTDDYERRRRRSRDETRRDDDDDANGDATDGERRYGSTALGISGDDDDGG